MLTGVVVFFIGCFNYFLGYAIGHRAGVKHVRDEIKALMKGTYEHHRS